MTVGFVSAAFFSCISMTRSAQTTLASGNAAKSSTGALTSMSLWSDNGELAT